MKRCCTNCSTQLTGKKGHGFPTFDGKGVWCGFCTFPPKKEKKGSRRRSDQ